MKRTMGCLVVMVVLVSCSSNSRPESGLDVAVEDLSGDWLAEVDLGDFEVCIPGTTKCFADSVWTCNGGGDGWISPEECPEEKICDNGECKTPDCVPDCAGKQCGQDGCGGECGICEGCGEVCQEHSCVLTCVPACESKNCGDDGCGCPCGECPDDQPCIEGQCCVADCTAKECGDDGCGGSCGSCAGGLPCQEGLCCQPDCAGKACGPDGCGKECGECPVWLVCAEGGQCQNACTLNCQGKQCGPDGCGGSCGDCAEALSCTNTGQCVSDCSADCQDKACGPDGCFDSCGVCGAGQFCAPDHKCYSKEICQPDCASKQCGHDGCGGTCGACGESAACTIDNMCSSYCSFCPDDAVCSQLAFETGNLFGWAVKGHAAVVKNLAAALPVEGQYMALVSTQVAKEGHISFETCLGAANPVATVSFDWKFYSEEFVEYCKAPYADTFSVYLQKGPETWVLLSADVHDLCAPQACNGCGSLYESLQASDVDLDKGDAYMTGWKHSEADVLGFISSGEPVTIHFRIEDDYDEKFDSLVLIDNIVFAPCLPQCEGKQCGDDGCQGECGQCDEGYDCSDEGVCQCIPKCSEKECGDDGCGGNCGICPEGTVCQQGSCKECAPDCFGKECGEDGCGGECGQCPVDKYCTPQGTCEVACQPQCDNKECGNDGCGDKCGSCDDFNVCTLDKCDPGVFVCTHLFTDGACDDGDPNTNNDTCVEGVCVGE